MSHSPGGPPAAPDAWEKAENLHQVIAGQQARSGQQRGDAEGQDLLADAWGGAGSEAKEVFEVVAGARLGVGGQGLGP